MPFVVFTNGALHCDMALLHVWLQTAHRLVSPAGMRPLNSQLTFPGLHTDPTMDPGAAPSLLLGSLEFHRLNSTGRLGIACSSAGDSRVLEMASRISPFIRSSALVFAVP